MKTKIQRLDDHLINQIAAGEVIENPASVVKELVENALDAKASQITVEIQSGGRHLIRVTDNGTGMSEEDAVLAFERHATSKISSFSDFNTLSTMGFRGEALPSIASISKCTLLTSEPEGTGTLIQVDSDQIQKTSAQRDPGTTIEVKSLFYNVPVRRQFQRSPNADKREISRILTGIALGNPTIYFTLIADGEEILNLPATSSPKERAAAAFGSEWLLEMEEVEFSRGTVHITGFISKPSATRHNRTGQHLFINRREVRSAAISQVVREAYGTTLSTGRYPLFLLYLELPGDTVDVNVHPRKLEVRFREGSPIKSCVYEAVQKALYAPVHSIPTPSSLPWEEEKVEQTFPLRFEEEQAPYDLPEQISLPIETNAPAVLATFKGHIIIESDEGFTLLDQRRAHKRIIYEKWIEKEAKIPTEPLLVPISFHAEEFPDNDFKRWGFTLSQVGPKTYQIEEIPRGFSQENLKETLLELADSLKKDSSETLAAKMAERGAIRRDRKLSLVEAIDLVRKWASCKTQEYCPKGKPITSQVTQQELAKRFGR